MRIHIKSLILCLALMGAGTALYSNDDACVPKRMGPIEWVGKNLGRGVDCMSSYLWNWVTDARYDGLTKLRRVGALGCFAYAGVRYVRDSLRAHGNRNQRPPVHWSVAGSTIAGILLIASPQPVYEVPCF